MAEFSALVPAKVLKASVNFGPEAELEFDFDVNKVTPLWFDKQRRSLEAEDVMTLARSLEELICSWNLTVDGEHVPPSEEVLSRFPIGHLSAMMEAISEQPTRAEGEVSSALSQAQSQDFTVTPQPLQNGQAPSESPKPSESLSPT